METLKKYKNWTKQARITYSEHSWIYTLFAFLNNWETASLIFNWKSFKTLEWAEKAINKFFNI